jgi:hypothetical protein
MNCESCKVSPELKEAFGCDKPTQDPSQWLDEDGQWFNCPIKFVSDDSKEFIQEYDSYKDNGSMPLKYNEQSHKYLEAKRTYEFFEQKYREIKNGKNC